MVPNRTVPPRRPGARPLHGFQQPFQLGGGEIGIEQKPGFPGYFRLQPLALRAAQRAAPRRSCRRQWGVVQGFSCRGVPDDAGFALVGDAQTGHPAFGHAFSDGPTAFTAPPDFPGSMLHLAAGGMTIRFKGHRMARQRPAQCWLARIRAGAIEQHGAGRGRPLVDREQESMSCRADYCAGLRNPHKRLNGC